MERTEMQRLERMIDQEVKLRFPAGAVRRAAVPPTGDDPEELLVRVFIAAAGDGDDPQRALDAWAQAHAAGMKRVRRELSLRLPEARLLEFTVDDAGDPEAAPRITMADDPALTSEPLSAREIVETTVALVRAGYVFPDLAEQAAAAVETRLAAGEYDDLDEAALAERLTGHLNEICADKHLRVRTMPPRPPRPGPAGPGPAGPGPAGPGRRRNRSSWRS